MTIAYSEEFHIFQASQAEEAKCTQLYYRKLGSAAVHVENKTHEQYAFKRRAHKEDEIIGLLAIDLERRANLAILGAC